MADAEHDLLAEVEDRLASLAVDSAVRAKVAADIREEICDAAGEMMGAVQMHLFDRIRLFVEEWRSAEEMLKALGVPLHPLDAFVVSEDEQRALDDLRALLPRILRDVPVSATVPVDAEAVRGPDGEYWYAPGGVIADLLDTLRDDPERWWTVLSLSKKTHRCEGSIYGKRGINFLVAQGIVEERRVQSERGFKNQQVRQFKIRGSKVVEGDTR